MLRELREDISDVVVWAWKFAAQNPGFGEVYHGVRLRHIQTWVPGSGEAPRDRQLGSRHKNLQTKNVNDYNFVTFILVHDANILSLARSMHRSAILVSNKFEQVLSEWSRSYINILPPTSLVTKIRKAINDYQFATASLTMDQLAQIMDKNAAVSTKSLKALSESAYRFAYLYKEKYKKTSTKQRILLSAYLDVDVP